MGSYTRRVLTPQVLQDGQVLGEAVKAPLLLADRNRMSSRRLG